MKVNGSDQACKCIYRLQILTLLVISIFFLSVTSSGVAFVKPQNLEKVGNGKRRNLQGNSTNSTNSTDGTNSTNSTNSTSSFSEAPSLPAAGDNGTIPTTSSPSLSLVGANGTTPTTSSPSLSPVGANGTTPTTSSPSLSPVGDNGTTPNTSSPSLPPVGANGTAPTTSSPSLLPSNDPGSGGGTDSTKSPTGAPIPFDPDYGDFDSLSPTAPTVSTDSTKAPTGAPIPIDPDYDDFDSLSPTASPIDPYNSETDTPTQPSQTPYPTDDETTHPTESSNKSSSKFDPKDFVDKEEKELNDLAKDKTADVLAILIAVFGLVGMIITAWQIMENPDGLCTSCCRLMVKAAGCLLKVIFLPCRLCCTKGKGYSGPDPSSPGNSMFVNSEQFSGMEMT